MRNGESDEEVELESVLSAGERLYTRHEVDSRDSDA